MSGEPTTGPVIESNKPKAPYNFAHFDNLMSHLQKWRNSDHQDMITLHRSQMIEIIDGVKALRERLDSPKH